MKKRDFLLEIGVEEMPARYVEETIQQLKTKTEKWFVEQRVEYASIQTFATPRRLAIWVKDVAERQLDQVVEAKGPAMKIAVDEDGKWTKAAEGFARGQGVRPDQLYVKEFKGAEYVFTTKEVKGEETIRLLASFSELITSLSFPKNMRWSTYEQSFIRPIRWLVALFGQEVVPLEVINVKAGNVTYGHRFLGHPIQLEEPSDYQVQLLTQYVIADAEDRKQAIRGQLKSLEQEKGWRIPVDEHLIDEVTYLVEYPTALTGSFDQEFLSIPADVLITTMKEHQRYFPVQDQNGSLLPHFVTIRNGDVDLEGVVVKGNEKVLKARLADARFFYEEDLKTPIQSAQSKLEHVVFHEELGTIGDKVRRIQEITKHIGKRIKLSPTESSDLDRAAEICKFDLVTQMVYEFPELQGKMGEEYALKAGEREGVAKAIYEHYLPRFAGDDLPQTAPGAILSVADKLDTIIGCFSIGIVPTGSQDPYALRRQAAGIIHTMLHHQWDLSLEELFQIVLQTYRNRQLLKRNEADMIKDLYQFFALRMKSRMQENQVRYDVIDALQNANPFKTDLHSLFNKANVLTDFLEKVEAKPLVESFTRVGNIAAKLDQEEVSVVPERFETEQEHALYSAYQQAKSQIDEYMKQKEWEQVLSALVQLEQPIVDFFDHVLVMVEEKALRINRLSLLKLIDSCINSFADFSVIVFPASKQTKTG